MTAATGKENTTVTVTTVSNIMTMIEYLCLRTGVLNIPNLLIDVIGITSILCN